MRDALQPEIQSERLLLRAWRPSDAEALFALFNNWEVVRWLSGPPGPMRLMMHAVTSMAPSSGLPRVQKKAML